MQIFLPPSNRFLLLPPQSGPDLVTVRWEQSVEWRKVRLATSVEKAGKRRLSQGIKVSITRDVSGYHAQPRLMCQAGHSPFAFLPPSLRAQSNHKIIRKAQTGGHLSGHNPVLPKAFRGQEKQRKTEKLSQTREGRGDVTTEGKVVLGLKPRTERGH